MHEGYLALLIPIVSIIFAIGAPLVILLVYLVLEYRKRRRLIELHHAERMAAIERGMEVPALPAELLHGSRSPRTGLRPGLILSLLGVAFLSIAAATGEDGHMIVGALALALGLAFLIYYGIEGRHNLKAGNGHPPHVIR